MSADTWLPLLHELADRADAIARKYFRAGDLHVRTKPDRSFVTQADLEIEEMARVFVDQRHPGIEVFGEEHGEDERRGGPRLIIDPIDGTANFARGVPVFATLLAIEEDGEVTAGLVSAPALAQRWHAAKGAGAWSGDRRLRVSGVTDLADAQIFHGSLAGSETTAQAAKLPALLARSWRQRGFGDFYQHVLVAEGCGEVSIDLSLQPWDAAPLIVLIEEAGGRATSLAGERSIYARSLVATNGLLHEAILAAFR